MKLVFSFFESCFTKFDFWIVCFSEFVFRNSFFEFLFSKFVFRILFFKDRFSNLVYGREFDFLSLNFEGCVSKFVFQSWPTMNSVDVSSFKNEWPVFELMADLWMILKLMANYWCFWMNGRLLNAFEWMADFWMLLNEWPT